MADVRSCQGGFFLRSNSMYLTLLQVIYGKMKNEVKECESLILLGEVHLNLHTSLHDFHV